VLRLPGRGRNGGGVLEEDTIDKRRPLVQMVDQEYERGILCIGDPGRREKKEEKGKVREGEEARRALGRGAIAFDRSKGGRDG